MLNRLPVSVSGLFHERVRKKVYKIVYVLILVKSQFYLHRIRDRKRPS